MFLLLFGLGHIITNCQCVIKFIHYISKYKGEMATRLTTSYAAFLDQDTFIAFREDGHNPLIKLLIGIETRARDDGTEFEVYQKRSPLLYSDPYKPTFDTIFANPTLPKVSALLLQQIFFLTILKRLCDVCFMDPSQSLNC
jgi:hypothetical protein